MKRTLKKKKRLTLISYNKFFSVLYIRRQKLSSDNIIRVRAKYFPVLLNQHISRVLLLFFECVSAPIFFDNPDGTKDNPLGSFGYSDISVSSVMAFSFLLSVATLDASITLFFSIFLLQNFLSFEAGAGVLRKVSLLCIHFFCFSTGSSAIELWKYMGQEHMGVFLFEKRKSCTCSAYLCQCGLLLSF